MSAVIVRKPTGPFPIWAMLMSLGLLLAAGALGYAYVLREGPGIDADTRSALLLTLAAGLGVFALGLGIPIVGMAFRAGSAKTLSLGSHRVVLGTTILVIIVSNLPPTIYGLATSVDNLRTMQGFLLAALSVEITLIAATYLRLIRSGQTSWRGLGFAPSRLLPDIGRGIAYGLGAFIVSALIQAGLDAAGVRQTQLKDFTWVRELDLSGFFLVLIVGALGAPLAEELYFRGYVFASYLRDKGPLAAYLFSGAVFASLHLNKEALLPIFVLGMMLAWMYRRSNSVVPPIVAHALNNGVAFLIFYFGPSLG